MKYQELRHKYPKFIYEKFEYEIVNGDLEIKFFYSIPPDHHFTHKINLSPNPSPKLGEGNQRGEVLPTLDNLIFHMGLSLMPSYWKSTCSPVIEIRAGNLSASQISFWEKLFLKGMGEYFYKNQIDFTEKDFLALSAFKTSPHPSPRLGEGEEGEVFKKIWGNNKVLVPVGGGKDSIVTLELLKPHYNVIPFLVDPVPLMLNVCKTASLSPFILTSTIDPHLHELNSLGYLNGHVPITATHSFEALLAAQITECKYITFSNERSSDEGNTEYLDHTINHQYSKSLEFETDFNQYLLFLNSHISYFSFLRPLYEIQITRIFSRYPQYFKIFSSCNTNFKLDPKSHPKGLWCQHCPKCVSTAMMLACFIGKDKVSEIMGSYPPDLPENISIMDDLLGKNPVKPFECVLTRAEANAAFTGKGLDRILSSWQDNPNMPKEFEDILKSQYLTPSVPLS